MAGPSVARAMQVMRRRDFLPPNQKRWARHDHPLSIGHGQTNSQPSTVATMLTLLDLRPGLTVLDLGAGSGWTTALLGYLVGPGGQIIGVELDPEIAAFGAANVERQNLAWTSVRTAQSGVLGWPDEAPFDRILVSADATSLPTPLVEQLGPDGVMVIVVQGVLLRLVRDGETAPTITEYGYYRFVPLR